MSLGRIMDVLVSIVYPHDGSFQLYLSSTIAPSSVDALALLGMVWPSNYGDLGDITQVIMTYSRALITIVTRGGASMCGAAQRDWLDKCYLCPILLQCATRLKPCNRL